MIDLVLAGHEPHPALAIDRHWTIVAANRALSPLLAGIEGSLLRAPVNALRVGLHPAGLAPRIINSAEWRAHLLARLHRQIDPSGDPVLARLLNEISEYPTVEGEKIQSAGRERGIRRRCRPLQLAIGGEVLSLISMTTVFSSPVDITLSEIGIEAFLPADNATAEALRRLTSTARS